MLGGLLCMKEPIKYFPYAIKVTRIFREQLLQMFPALETHKWSTVYLQLFQYLLNNPLRDEDDPDKIVLPAEVVAKFAHAKVGVNGFRAIDLIEGFSSDVFPLHVTDYIPNKVARCVEPMFTEPLKNLMGENGIESLFSKDRVMLVTGKTVTSNSIKTACIEYSQDILESLEDLDKSHPAYELQQYLNSQSQITLAKTVRQNTYRLMELLENTPEGERKNSITFLLIGLQDWVRNYYAGSDKSVRIFTRGISIHNLPREFRKTALSGSTEFDMRSSQLAIVAKLWNLPKVAEFLKTGKSFWTMMTKYLNINASYKSILKDRLYATCFGEGTGKALDQLTGEIGRTAAEKFFRHELLQEVLAGRTEALRHIKSDGGITDAFGFFSKTSKEVPAYKLLSREAQSWELKLMLPVFETVRDVRDLSILSWLHDGMVIRYTQNKETRHALNMRVIEAFNANATLLGFATDLEMDLL